MIKGNKASGYLQRGMLDGSGKIDELETRQCVHCQFTWIYQPGSGRKFGVCLKCHGITCMKPECLRVCDEKHAPFADGNDDSKYKMTPGGVMIPASDYGDIRSRLVA